MRKRLFTSLVALSVVTLLAWAWSYVGVGYGRSTRYFAIISGSFESKETHWTWGHLPTERNMEWRWWIGASEGRPTKWLPHYEWDGSHLPYVKYYTIVLPLWIPFVLFATYPAVTMIRSHRRRKRQRADGCCSKCEYDLRGNVSGICPECGTKMVTEALVDRSRPPAPPSKRNDHGA